MGTAVEALMASSARWMAPSSPEYMKLGLTRPVKKTSPSGHPESLTKFFQTYSEGCFGFAMAKLVIKKMKKHRRDNATAMLR